MKRRHKLFWTALFVLVTLPRLALYAESATRDAAKENLSLPRSALTLAPAVSLPIGASSQVFNYTGSIAADYQLALGSGSICMVGEAEIGYSTALRQATVSLGAAALGLAVQVPLFGRMSLTGLVLAGYYGAKLNESNVSSSDPYIEARLGARIPLLHDLFLTISGSYQNYLGLYQGVGAVVGATYAFGYVSGAGSRSASVPKEAPAPASMQPLAEPNAQGPVRPVISNVTLDPVFPVLFKYYDNHPIGRLVLENKLSVPLGSVSAQVYIQQFMDNPKETDLNGMIQPGGKQAIDLYALFNDKVLSITEGTKVSGEITVSYTARGTTDKISKTMTFDFLNRNAMTWDDNRKAAAFVTQNDPSVLTFAKNVMTYLRSTRLAAVNDNLQSAMAIHDALDSYGMTYVQDPNAPYSQMSQKKDEPDFLQFPRQTLEYKAGDCDDLSILVAALLESVGVRTAFITIPGHIYIAFDTGATRRAAIQSLIPPDRIIIRGGEAWIPIEVTIRNKGFLAAWQEGMREWNQYRSSQEEGFYPVETAWDVFAPVGLPASSFAVTVPMEAAVLVDFHTDLNGYVRETVRPAESRYLSQIKANGSVEAMNRLGVLYGTYHQLDKAEAEFKMILSKEPNVAAYLNLGNIYYIRQDWARALSYYQKALAMAPKNPHVLLDIARANQQFENYGNAKSAYQELANIDPKLANEFSYLATGANASTRSSDVENRMSRVLWEE